MRRQRLRKQQNLQSTRSVPNQSHALHRFSPKPIPMHPLVRVTSTNPDNAQLLPRGTGVPFEDEDEVDLLVETVPGSTQQNDTAWINMLHSPRSKHR
ncbi:unnamed protein product [Echinostoma caproni]|uniref:Uncharacterized protein n=1 Tax=Echinostoma caproni TaxID=27848 RepID=A0A183APR9_9TREM|nr:unnamed protein product [Echinostoma caproni]